jgi:hypothetical protein
MFIFCQIKSLGAKAGVVLNPGTPLSAIEYVLECKICSLCNINSSLGMCMRFGRSINGTRLVFNAKWQLVRIDFGRST